MRHGRLLAQDNPEHLLKKYSVATLEDVFLKLCTKDKKASEAKENNISAEEQQEMNYSESHEEIWVLRKVIYMYIYVLHSCKYTGQFKKWEQNYHWNVMAEKEA